MNNMEMHINRNLLHGLCTHSSVNQVSHQSICFQCKHIISPISSKYILMVISLTRVEKQKQRVLNICVNIIITVLRHVRYNSFRIILRSKEYLQNINPSIGIRRVNIDVIFKQVHAEFSYLEINIVHLFLPSHRVLLVIQLQSEGRQSVYFRDGW